MLLMACMIVPWVTNAQDVFNFEDNVIPAGWTNSTTYPWVVTSTSQDNGHNGTYCIKSGNSGVSSSTSSISATFTLVTDGSISFLGGIYGEGTSTVWDKCIFEIDGVQQFSYGALAAWATYTFPLTAGQHTFTWKYSKDSSVNPTGDAFFVDDVVVEGTSIPDCYPVRNLAIIDSLTTSESITLTWSDPNNSSATYNVYIINGADTNLVGTTSDSSFSIDTLQPNTLYFFGVESDCGGDGPSVMRVVSGRTACAAISVLPYYCGFEANEITSESYPMPWCWTRNVSDATNNYYPYVISSTAAFNGDGVLYWYSYSSSYYSDTMVAVMPPLDVETYPLSGNRISFMAKLTGDGSMNIMVGTMTDPSNRGTVTILDTVAVTGTEYNRYFASFENIDTDNEDAYVALVVFKGSNTIYLDDIVLEEQPNCPDVTGLTVGINDSTSIYVIWDSVAADNYEVEVRQGDTIVSDVNVTVDGITAEVTGLVLDDDYQIYVRAICGSEFGAWTLPAHLHFGYCIPNPTSVDGSGIASISTAYDTVTTHPITAPYYGDYNDIIIDSVPAGTDGTMNITYATGYTYGTIIWIDFNNNMTFDTNEVVYRGTSTNANPTTLTATYHIPSTVEPGVYRMRIAGADSYFDNAVSGTSSPDPCFTSTYAIAEDYSIEILEAPECLPVEYFTYVDSLTAGHTATFLWTSDAGSFQVEYKKTTEQDWTIETVSDTIVTLTDLDAETAYMIRVKALCGSDESLYSSVLSFSTTVACPAPTGLRAILTPGDGTTATLVWTDLNGSAWQICFNGDTNNYIDVTDTTSITFDTLTPEQAYTAKVRRNCTEDEDGYSLWSSTITFTPTDAYMITVNDGTTTNGYVPIYGFYVDDHTQSRFIIPASALSQIEFGIINKLVFHASTASAPWTGASFEVYMTETDATTVSSVVSTDDMDQVYTGSLSIVGNKMEVNFSTPYQYMGGNLMIAFEQPTSGTYTSCSWYGVTANGASMGGYGSSVSQRNFLPKTTIYYTPGVEPTCFPVSNLVVIDSMTTTESITVAWMDTINTTATYDVYVVNGTDTTAYTASDTVYTIENLQHSTTYTIIVAANCGSDAAIARSVVANTACAAVTDFPWSEDFENYAAGNLEINCWENVHISGSGSQIFKIYTSTIVDNATHKLQLPDMTSGTQTKLALPTMELQEGTRYMFSIDVCRNASGTSYTSEGVRVFVSTNGEIAGAHELGFLYRNYTQTDGGVVHAENASGWYNYEFIIPDSISGNVNIILRGESSYGSSTYMDNLSFMVAPDCSRPQQFAIVDSLTAAHTATFTWSGDASSYQIEYKLASDTTWTTDIVSDTTAVLTGLAANSAYNVRVKALCDGDESLYSNVINFTTTVSCPAPTGLRAILTPGDGTTATLVWSDPTGSAWQICLNGDTNYITVTDSATFTFDTLTPEQAYTAKVRRDCTDEQEGYSTWSSMITFVPTDAYYLTVNDGTTTNSYVPIYGLWVDNNIHSRFIIPASDLSQMEFGVITQLVFHASNTSVSWGSASFQVYLTETTDTTVSSVVPTTDMELVYTGSLSIVNNKMEVVFDTPYQYMGGNLMIAFEEPTSGTYQSCSWYGVNATGASMGGYGSSVSQRDFLPKTTIYFIPGDEPTCFPVSNLTVDETLTTDESITVTWEDTVNSTATYDLYIINGTDTVSYTTSTTSYTFENLQPSTEYTIVVVSNCGSGDVAMMRSVVTHTDCGGGSCPITIVGTDGYGDGWNGGYIDIVQNGISIAHCTVTDQGLEDTPITETYTYQVCSGSPVTFLWNSGEYDDEVSFIIKNANDSVLYTVSNAETLTDGAVFYTATNPCDGAPVVVPDTFYVTLNSANATMGTVSPAGTTAVVEGHTFTATATPATNHVFTGWVNAAGDTVSHANPYTFEVTVDITLTGTFAYTGVGIEAVSLDNVNLFPNPASTSVTLSGLEAKAMVTLVDVNGHVSGQWKAEGNTLTIDLTNYATGTYFVRIVGEQAVAVRKLIIK